MKMQRYLAKDMRQALAQIRAQQGPDAVILSTQRTPEGVMVCAAVDYEFSPEPAAEPVVAPAPADEARPRTTVPMPPPADSMRAEMGAVGEEIRGLRRLLEIQVAALAWNDFTRRQPMKARVLEELTNVGLCREIALAVVNDLPEDLDAERASGLPLAHLARRVLTTTSPTLEHGGRLALVGPNGVGKTTTLAKLATRWVMEHGPRDVALVTTDRDRFGSHEQLLSLGRLLGVPAFITDSPAELGGLLERLHERRLVLIDTPGLNPRSERFTEELGGLCGGGADIEIALVLAASAQAGSLEEAVARFAALRPAHCVLTKVDEATSLGGAISALARSALPVAWLCKGTRVPEDIEPARAHHLVVRAVELARTSGATVDEDLLARRFGGLCNAAA
jgi:flagellar biosynthesis protein FlhF